MKKVNRSIAGTVGPMVLGAGIALATTGGVVAAPKYGPGGGFGAGETVRVEGYVTHGVNVFNDQYIADYSSASPQVPWLNPVPPLYEIGVFAEGADDSEIITPATDPSRLVATNRRFVELFGLAADPDLFNRTLDQVGSNFFGFQNITDRIVPVAFEDASEATVYRRVNTNPAPTLEEWNQITGLITYRCFDDGSATVEVLVAKAFPNAIYTLWDVGAVNPLTQEEQGYAVPLGGVPNTFQTDDNGCGSVTVRVPYCPGRPCEAGATSCSSYLSIAHHWDQQTYGASPAASFLGVPVGAYTANHMVWPMSGVALQEPQNPWTPSAASACKK